MTYTGERLFISFSGGETSAYMAQWLLKNTKYKEVQVLFANTGQENEETLEFIEQCDKHFGLNVKWIEAVIHHGEKLGPTHRIVDHASASRNGAPFEEMIKKYGIPNNAMPHCTRALKVYPLTSYLRSIGWGPGTYDTAIGIRKDEADRMSPKFKENRIIYPLISKEPMSKQDINIYWRDMPFRLRLKGYQGNCKWCWKKSLRKHMTLMKEDPTQYDFPERMEREYPRTGACKTDAPKVFFRKDMSTLALRDMAAKTPFIPAADDAINYNGSNYELDFTDGCSESCEVNHDQFDYSGKELELE